MTERAPCVFRDTHGRSMESDGRKVLLWVLIAMRVGEVH